MWLRTHELVGLEADDAQFGVARLLTCSPCIARPLAQLLLLGRAPEVRTSCRKHQSTAAAPVRQVDGSAWHILFNVFACST